MSGPSRLHAGTGTNAALDDLLDDLGHRLQAGERLDLEALIQQHPELADELRRCLPSLQVLAGLQNPPEGPALGELGDFRILREVGRGGMGVVYEAEQISLGRRVALKVLPFAAAMDAKQLQRFKNEAQAAGHLQHTNIVPVYYVGCERGVHFYAMQFIEGQTLAAMIHELRLGERGGESAPSGVVLGALSQPRSLAAIPTGPFVPTTPAATLSTEHSIKNQAYFRTVARLGEQAAEALEHAHEMGVIHRDVKPGNLLVDGRGNLWITDFGLALCQSQAGLTMTGDLVGTLRYMSPEQALAKRVIVDHRTDVYSMGATLYELLTLEPAFAGQDRQELLRQIAFEEPRPPRRLNKAIPAVLETIVLKALEKNPAERYATAKELADDLRRFLEDKPIRARRPGLATRAAKWARRHRAVVWSAAALVCVAVVALVISTIEITAAYREQTKQRKAAEQERDLAKRFQYDSDIGLAQQALRDADVDRMQALLERHVAQPGQPDLRDWEWYYLQSAIRREVMNGDGAFSAIRWSPDGKLLAVSGTGQPLQVWDIEGRQKATFCVEKTSELAWAPDGKSLGATKAHGPLVVFAADSGRELLSMARALNPLGVGGFRRQSPVRLIDWSPDGLYLTGSDGNDGRLITIWALPGNACFGA